MLRLLKKFFTRRLALQLMAGFAIGVLLVGAAGVLHTRVAYADDIAGGDTVDDDCSGLFCSVFEAFGNVIATLINAVSALIGQLIQLLADGIIELIAYSAKVVEMPAVQAGFQVSLGVVNLIFVMALIVISFQIILGVHEGEAKKQLVNVIIAAILVNFSLLIAGLLLDISNVFTVFFMHPVTSENIRGALNPSQFRAMNELSSGGGFFAAIMPALFSLFMSAIILIILIAVFATVLMRLLRVACLLLVMPLTWGFWVFPGLDKYYKEWWHEFIKWGVVMLPTMTFFMYLGIMTVNQMANWTGARPADQTIQGTLGGLLQMLIIGGIMVAGIKIGQEAGGISASAAVGAAKSAAGYAAKIPGVGMVSRGIQRGALKPAVGKFADKSAEWASSTNPIKSMLGKAAVMTGAAKTAAGYSHVNHDLEEAMKEEYGDNKDTMGTKQTVATAMSATTDNGRAKAYLAMQRKGEGAFKEMVKTEAGRNQLAAMMKSYGAYTHNDTKDLMKESPALKKVLSANPETLAMIKSDGATSGPTYDKELTEAYQKMDTAALKELDMEEVVKSPERMARMTSSLSGQQLSQAARKNGQNQVLVRYATIRTLISQVPPDSGDDRFNEDLVKLERNNNALKEAIDSGNQNDIIKISATISQQMDKLQPIFEAGSLEGPGHAAAYATAQKFEKVDKVSGMLGEFTVSGGDGDKA